MIGPPLGPPEPLGRHPRTGRPYYTPTPAMGVFAVVGALLIVIGIDQVGGRHWAGAAAACGALIVLCAVRVWLTLRRRKRNPSPTSAEHLRA